MDSLHESPDAQVVDIFFLQKMRQSRLGQDIGAAALSETELDTQTEADVHVFKTRSQMLYESTYNEDMSF